MATPPSSGDGPPPWQNRAEAGTGDPRVTDERPGAALREQPSVPGGAPAYPPGYALPPYPYYQQPPRERRRGVPWWVWLVAGIIGFVALIAIACAVLFGALAGMVVRVANEKPASSTITRTFPLTDAPSVVINIPAGSVNLRSGADGQVTVQMITSVRAATTSQAHQGLNTIHASASAQGNDITITGSLDSASGLMSRRVDVFVTVPANARVISMTVPAGSVMLWDVSATWNVDVNAGSVTATGITLNDGSRIAANVGTVMLAGTLAPGASTSITVNTGSAELRVPASTQAHIHATTDVGGIEASGWSLSPQHTSATAEALDGNLGTSPAQGNVTIHVATGDIKVGQR